MCCNCYKIHDTCVCMSMEEKTDKYEMFLYPCPCPFTIFPRSLKQEHWLFSKMDVVNEIVFIKKITIILFFAKKVFTLIFMIVPTI